MSDNGWISVKDVLPYIHQDVLITDNKSIYMGRLGNDQISWFTDLPFNHHKNIGCYAVTHWMPLPPLPNNK